MAEDQRLFLLPAGRQIRFVAGHGCLMSAERGSNQVTMNRRFISNDHSVLRSGVQSMVSKDLFRVIWSVCDSSRSSSAVMRKS